MLLKNSFKCEVGVELYLIWRGDMLLKKTDVRLGSTFWSTHWAHVLRTLPYAIGRSISSYSVDP